MLRFLTAGESHGPKLLALLEGLPAGLAIDEEYINRQLARRQQGHGRGGRMRIEQDRVRIVSGVRHGLTLGSPLSLEIENRDWPNWQEDMSPTRSEETRRPPVTRPRPGHADLAGGLKYGHTDLRNILERASARETAARVAAGSIARLLLLEFQIEVFSYVVRIGQAALPTGGEAAWRRRHPRELAQAAEGSPVRCFDPATATEMVEVIDAAARARDTLGGVFEVVATGVPLGLGSHVQWDRRLDARLAAALMGLNAIKGVEIGLGFAAAERPGSEVHDPIYGPVEQEREALPGSGPAGPYFRATNGAGGVEGGITTGQPLVVRAAMKPIATLGRGLPSVDMQSGEAVVSHHERSDFCAVPAASVIGETLVVLILAEALLEKFGGDSLAELKRNFAGYVASLGGEAR